MSVQSVPDIVDHCCLRCIYLKQIDDHVPLAAVADEVARCVYDESLVDGEICMLNGELEVVVRLVQFVPEKQVRLTNTLSRLVDRQVLTTSHYIPARAGSHRGSASS